MTLFVSYSTGEICQESLDNFEDTRAYHPPRQDGENDSTFGSETPWSFDNDTVTEPSVTSTFVNPILLKGARLEAINIKSVIFKCLSVGEETEWYIENDEGLPEVINLSSYFFPVHLLLKNRSDCPNV